MQIVAMHHAPFSSGQHGSTTSSQWCETHLCARLVACLLASRLPCTFLTLPGASVRVQTMRLPLRRRPFETWGADAVMAGHDHIYERLSNPRAITGKAGFPYTVNGLGASNPFGGSRTLGSPL